MAQLAIKGHETRGKEVIEILEMLGGKNIHNYNGTFNECYVIDNDKICTIYTSVAKIDGFVIITLEEFLEKFPYKVGDKVMTDDADKANIVGMVWDNDIDDVFYETQICNKVYKYPKELLQPYKEETMEDKLNLLQQLKEYFESAPREVIEKEWHEYDKYNEISPKVSEYLEYVNNIRQPKYPKTYEGCCEVLGHVTIDEIRGYKDMLLDSLQMLLICRDAYWKIAGEQMGLGKPWKQDYNDRCFIIANNNGNIHTYEYHGSGNVILAFPTEEMRDVFYENFKELIIECMELL